MSPTRLSRRELLRTAGIGALGLLAAACGPAATPVADETAGEMASTASAVPSPAAAAPSTAGERIELRYATWGDSNWDTFIQMFNESQDRTHVTFEQIAFDAYREKMLTAMAANAAPDVLEMSHLYMPEFVDKNLLLELDPFLANQPGLAKERWLPGTFLPNLQIFDGKTYGLPSGDSPKVIWFAPDSFKEAGLKTPLEYEAAGEWNWDTFRAAVQELSGGEGSSRRYGYSTWMGRNDTDDIMRSFGGGWTDQEVTEVWATKPESVTGLQYILDIYLKDKAAPLAQDLDALGGGLQLFLTGRLAMYMSGVWEALLIKNAGGTIAYDVAPLPTGPAGRYMYHSPNAIVIPRSSAHPDECAEFAAFIKSPAVEDVMVQANGFMPFTTDSVDAFLTKGKIPNAKLFIEALEKGWGHPVAINKNGARMDQAVGDALGLALSEGRDAAWVTNEVASQLEALVTPS